MKIGRDIKRFVEEHGVTGQQSNPLNPQSFGKLMKKSLGMTNVFNRTWNTYVRFLFGLLS